MYFFAPTSLLDNIKKETEVISEVITSLLVHLLLVNYSYPIHGKNEPQTDFLLSKLIRVGIKDELALAPTKCRAGIIFGTYYFYLFLDDMFLFLHSCKYCNVQILCCPLALRTYVPT